MPFFQEATFHDRQAASSMAVQTTSSAIFTDVTGATITAKDLAQPGAYLGWLSLLLSNNANNAMALFRLTLNGDVIGNIAEVSLRVKDLDVGYTLMSDLGGVGIVGGDVLQLQFATDLGTLTLVEFSLVVDGVPSSRVV